MNPKSESRTIAIKDDPFLLSLVHFGLVYQDIDPNKEVELVALRGERGDDYAVYFWTPDMPFKDVASFGSKLPEEDAKRLFPEWAARFKYRR